MRTLLKPGTKRETRARHLEGEHEQSKRNKTTKPQNKRNQTTPLHPKAKRKILQLLTPNGVPIPFNKLLPNGAPIK